MTQLFFPFDAGAGANVTEEQWRKMARFWLATGVLDGEDNEAEVYADSSGMQVKVRTGKAWVRGHYWESDAEETLAIDAADATNPRIDRVILRADFSANTLVLAVLTGTPAASPVAPSLTQSTSRWEKSLAQVSVPAAASTIAAVDVTDERELVPTGILSWLLLTDTPSAYTGKALAVPRVNSGETGLELVGFRGALANLTANQSIANNTLTIVSWDAVEYDTDGFWDAGTPSRLTVPSGVSRVRLSTFITWSSNSTGVRTIDLRKNTLNFVGSVRVDRSAEGRSAASAASPILSVAAGDYFEIRVQQTSGGSLDLTSDLIPWFALEVVE